MTPHRYLSYWLFVARGVPGIVLIVAGLTKVGHFSDFAAVIAGFRLLPASTIAPLAILLPFFEIGVGLYLFCGLFSRVTAIIGGLQYVVYGAAVALAVLRHIPASCGCFGPADTAVADWPHVAVDLAFAACCAAIVRYGPGAISFDAAMRKA